MNVQPAILITLLAVVMLAALTRCQAEIWFNHSTYNTHTQTHTLWTSLCVPVLFTGNPRCCNSTTWLLISFVKQVEQEVVGVLNLIRDRRTQVQGNKETAKKLRQKGGRLYLQMY